MAYRLALDIGTASLGLIALVLDDKSAKPAGVVHSALHIFSEPLLPPKSGGVGEPKKAARRIVRQERRLSERRARRLRRIAHLAPLIGLDASTVPPDDGQHIHALRARAIDERIELPDLLNVLLKLAKRRGYAGGFRVRKESEEAGQVESGIQNLRDLLKANDCRTLGQLLNKRFGDSEHAGRGPRGSLKLKDLGLYAHREMIEEEFDLIWAEQSKHHSILNQQETALTVRGELQMQSVRQHFREALFHQRPLKSVASMVGTCPLQPTLPRAPAAQPAAQAFRIEKQLADLRWGMGRAQRPLTAEQHECIRALLIDPAQLGKDGSLSFAKIYRALDKAGLRPEFPRQFNADRFSRESLVGDRTGKVMMGLGVRDAWNGLDDTTRLRVINFVADLGSPDVVDAPRWHERMQPRPKPEVVAFIDKWVEAGTFARLGKMGFDIGRAAYSVKALRQLTSKMHADKCDEHAARESLYPAPDPTGELLMYLPQPSTTGNVVVDVALRVVRHAVNRCLQTMGEPPAQVIVEMSRDMALGIKARGEKEKTIDRNRRARVYAKAQIEASDPGRSASANDIFRYLLAQEQDFHCPYCASRLELAQVLDGNSTNVDHILPRSLTQVKRLRSHIVIAHRACNAAKGNRAPLEAFAGDADRVSAIENCANIVRKRSHRKANFLLAESYEAEKITDKTLEDFTERQFAETSWIAKLVAQWMKSICSNVSVSRGELTAQLRRAWKLETVIPQVRLEAGLPLMDDDSPPRPITHEEFDRFRACWDNHHGPEVARTDRRIDKRIDHRHHLIDALVIGLTDRSLYMQMAKDYKERMEQRLAGVRGASPWQTPQPPLREVRDVALGLIKEAKIQHKTDRYPTGAFFKGMAYAKAHTDQGKSRLVRSVELLELTDDAGSVEVARRGIGDIFSPVTRDIVSREFDRRISEGHSVRSALSSPIVDTRYGTLIRRVRVYQRDGRGFASGEDAIKVQLLGRSLGEERIGEKFYQSDGYAFIALIHDGQGRVTDAISIRRANATLFAPAHLARRIFRNDTVVTESGERHLVHQILAGGSIRTAPVTESRGWAQSKEAGRLTLGKAAVMRLKIEP